ncbi:hypothetical protein BJ085DRAFT_37369 [Dimargaris cristalligena]|uniref:Uncharacterized protein n=1 Tax=Dimargaris cristalligena TaxID=215637 RepID=A0A4V1J550_9FUNG|nr:hypothetical protein BJ085DRAFT_37369 [Dimargaris cristalligena]|eukprot:RKP37829.1 hypothetical protein BJ085DRAFT_37369 [Dimargaris cristalligena]
MAVLKQVGVSGVVCWISLVWLALKAHGSDFYGPPTRNSAFMPDMVEYRTQFRGISPSDSSVPPSDGSPTVGAEEQMDLEEYVDFLGGEHEASFDQTGLINRPQMPISNNMPANNGPLGMVPSNWGFVTSKPEPVPFEWTPAMDILLRGSSAQLTGSHAIPLETPDKPLEVKPRKNPLDHTSSPLDTYSMSEGVDEYHTDVSMSEFSTASTLDALPSMDEVNTIPITQAGISTGLSSIENTPAFTPGATAQFAPTISANGSQEFAKPMYPWARPNSFPRTKRAREASSPPRPAARLVPVIAPMPKLPVMPILREGSRQPHLLLQCYPGIRLMPQASGDYLLNFSVFQDYVVNNLFQRNQQRANRPTRPLRGMSASTIPGPASAEEFKQVVRASKANFMKHHFTSSNNYDNDEPLLTRKVRPGDLDKYVYQLAFMCHAIRQGNQSLYAIYRDQSTGAYRFEFVFGNPKVQESYRHLIHFWSNTKGYIQVSPVVLASEQLEYHITIGQLIVEAP